MYNYYCEQKKKQLEEDQRTVERRENRYKEKRKKMLTECCEKYENRIKDFIMDMVHSPIRVKDCTNPIESTRMELLKEEDNKITGRRGMVLKGFKTEKERIKEHLRNINNLHPMLDQKIDATDKLDKILILQPEMRFKARTDLERITEEINKVSMGRVNKNVVDKQLKELDLTVLKKTEPEEEVLEFKSENTAKKQKKNRTQESKEQPDKFKKDHKSDERRKNRNQEAKHLMSDLHNKTHFKGATEIANRISNHHTDRPIRINYLNAKDLCRITEENFYSKEMPRDYKKNFNPYFNTRSHENLNLTNLNFLQKMAFSNEKEKSKLDTNEDLKRKMRHLKDHGKEHNKYSEFIDNFKIRNQPHFGKNLTFESLDDPLKKEEERVSVDNQVIQRSRVDLIAVKILRICNVSHQKSKSNNTSLKNGEGKLMMTNGMTINEFESKYNL